MKRVTGLKIAKNADGVETITTDRSDRSVSVRVDVGNGQDVRVALYSQSTNDDTWTGPFLSLPGQQVLLHAKDWPAVAAAVEMVRAEWMRRGWPL
jgi:hypothetical protein